MDESPFLQDRLSPHDMNGLILKSRCGKLEGGRGPKPLCHQHGPFPAVHRHNTVLNHWSDDAAGCDTDPRNLIFSGSVGRGDPDPIENETGKPTPVKKPGLQIQDAGIGVDSPDLNSRRGDAKGTGRCIWPGKSPEA